MVKDKEVHDIITCAALLTAQQYINYKDSKKNNAVLSKLKLYGKDLKLIANKYEHHATQWFYIRDLVRAYIDFKQNNPDKAFNYRKYEKKYGKELLKLNPKTLHRLSEKFQEYAEHIAVSTLLYEKIINDIKNQEDIQLLQQESNEYLIKLSVCGSLDSKFAKKTITKILHQCSLFQN